MQDQSAPTNSASEGKNHDCVTSSHVAESQLHILEWRDFDTTLVSGVFALAFRVLKSPRHAPDFEYVGTNGRVLGRLRNRAQSCARHFGVGRGGFETRLYGNREAWAAENRPDMPRNWNKFEQVDAGSPCCKLGAVSD